MGEKGNSVAGAEAAAGAGSSLVAEAGSATANVVLDTGETLRGKLIESAADAAIDEGRDRLQRDPDAAGDGPAAPA